VLSPTVPTYFAGGSTLVFPPATFSYQWYKKVGIAAPVAITAALGGLAATYTVATSLNMQVTLLDCIVLMQPVALVANLPISVGGWGVRETAMIALFGLIGVPASATLVLSIQLGLLSLIVALPGGLLWLALKSRAPSLSVASSSSP